MAIKFSQQENYHVPMDKKRLKHLVSKKLLKSFILRKRCFSDAENAFLQPKILKILNKQNKLGIV